MRIPTDVITVSQEIGERQRSSDGRQNVLLHVIKHTFVHLKKVERQTQHTSEHGIGMQPLTQQQQQQHVFTSIGNGSFKNSTHASFSAFF